MKIFALVMVSLTSLVALAADETHTAVEPAASVEVESSEEGRNGFSSVSLGGVMATPIGDRARIYNGRAGIQAEVTLRSDEWLGRVVDLYASAHVQPYGIVTVPGVKLVQWTGVFGLETRTDAMASVVRPFLGVGFGWTFSRLSYDRTFSNPASNEGVIVVAQIKPGVKIPLIDGLSLLAQAPITIPLAKNRFGVLNGMFGLRWDF
jgi:hypothetical protein